MAAGIGNSGLVGKRVRSILVEGPDCSGKSTVVERLKNMLRWDATSLHHREGDQFQRYLREYALAENVVFDRGHFSEEVYSRLWRGGSPFSPSEREILNAICTQSMIIIFACPSLELMKQRYHQRPFEQQIKLVELEESRTLFCATIEQIPHILYTSQNYEELDTLLRQVQQMIPAQKVIGYEIVRTAGRTSV